MRSPMFKEDTFKMASKQKPKGFSRFLDLIGLVDNDRDDETEQTGAANRRSARRPAARDDYDEFSEFEEQPQSRSRAASSQNSGRSRTRVNLEDDSNEFSDESWTNTRRAAAQKSASSYQQQRSSASRSGYTPGSYRAQNSTSGNAQRSSARSSAGGYTSRYASEGEKRRSASDYESYYARSSGASERYSSSYEDAPRASGDSRQQTVVCTLHSIEECKNVILALVDKKTILLNLDRLDPAQAQRAVDTMCGATYAIGATLTRASERAWLLTPSTVEVTSTDSNKY